MIQKEFKNQLIEMISRSTVNLGRDTPRRTELLQSIEHLVDEYFGQDRGRIKVLKPDRSKVMDVGHGVTAMTASESSKADREAGRHV